MGDDGSTLICPATQPVLRDEWYVVAFSHESWELRASLAAPLLWRTDRALSGRARRAGRCCAIVCPHRGSPLSLGKMPGTPFNVSITFQFGGDGRCVRVPSQAAIVPGSRCRAIR